MNDGLAGGGDGVEKFDRESGLRRREREGERERREREDEM